MEQNNSTQRLYGISSWILVSFLMFIVFNPGVSEANAGWANLNGKPICGGIVNGKLQDACENKEATYVSESIKKCPEGSFRAKGSCYSCPSGYNKTAFNVEKEKACSKNVKDEFDEATFVGQPRCKLFAKADSRTGTFDPRKGGECWSCPADHGRTVHGVNKWNACKKGLKKSVSATFKGKACKDGAFGDPRKGGECWSCPAEFHRTARAVTHKTKACIKTEDFKTATKTSERKCKDGEIFDLIDGGTCWTCPTGYKRSWHSVKSAKACKATTLDWQPPEPTMPGLFGLKGATAVAIELIKERTQIDETLENMAKNTDNNPEAWKKEEWERIKTEPWRSSVLSTSVLLTAIEASKKPLSKRSKTEKDLVKSVSDGIQHHRLFLATQMKQAFDNALATSEKEIEKQNAGGMQALFGGIATAPDYSQLTQVAIGGAGAGMVGLGMVAIMYSPAASAALFPFRRSVRQAAQKAAQKVVEKVVQSTAQKVGSSMLNFASISAGPLIIITGAVLIAQMELDKIIQTAKTEGKIRQAIDQAKGKLDLAIFLEKEGGFEEIMYHWGALMNGTTKPRKAFYDALNADTKPSIEDVAKQLESDGLKLVTGPIGETDNSEKYTAAITLGKGRTYLFAADGTYSRTNWGRNKGFDASYPKNMPGNWKKFPESWYNGIDAAMTKGGGDTAYMWKDGQYMRLKGLTVDGGYPKKMPGGWKKMPPPWNGDVDAAFYYPKAKKHYLFKGNQYARVKGTTVDKGYPKDLPGGWKGMPDNFAEGIDAATFRKDHVYMIKGDEYIRFTGTKMDEGYPKKIKDNWPK